MGPLRPWAERHLTAGSASFCTPAAEWLSRSFLIKTGLNFAWLAFLIYSLYVKQSKIQFFQVYY